MLDNKDFLNDELNNSNELFGGETTYIGNESIPDSFDLDDILNEYGVFSEPVSSVDSSDIREKSEAIVAEAFDQLPEHESYHSAQGFVESAIDEAVHETEIELLSRKEADDYAIAEEVFSADYKAEREEVVESRDSAEESFEAYNEIQESLEEDETEASEQPDEQLQEETSGTNESSSELLDGDGTEVAAAEAADSESQENAGFGSLADEPRKKRNFISPLAAIVALITVRAGQKKEPEVHFVREYTDDLSDPDPKKSTKFYSGQVKEIRKRANTATFLTLIMLLLTLLYAFGVNLPGNLGRESGFSCVMLIMLCSCALASLDVFTKGITSIMYFKGSHEALAALSCIFAVIDAIVCALTGNSPFGAPYCCVAAASLTCELWGSYYFSKACRSSFKVLSAAGGVSSVSSSEYADGRVTHEDDESEKGFVRRTEEPDCCEKIYSVIFVPVVIAAIVFAVVSCAVSKEPKGLIHFISGFFAISASFSAGICFSFPFCSAAKRMYYNYCAIAGWKGAAAVGKCKYVSIQDKDLFPEGTVSAGSVRILENAAPEFVISCTASVLKQSHSGLYSVFSDMAVRAGTTTMKVDEFNSHDGLGMTALADGSSVAVGGVGFMNLCGIRVPRKLMDRYSVYTAIDGKLAGIFQLNYRITTTAQRAMADLISSGFHPVIMCRDFNVSPAMIKHRFKISPEKIVFPPYSERFRTEETFGRGDTVAVFGKTGIESLADIAVRGGKLRKTAVISSVIAAAGTIVGMVMLLVLFSVGAFTSAGAANISLFMILWLLPAIILTNA